MNTLLWVATCAWAFPDHDQPHRSGAKAPGDQAVVIGIEDYFALPDVPFATRDADAVEDLLLYSLGLPADAIQRLSAQASRESIEAAVAEAAAEVGPEGTLWIYFAGHGAASPTTGERLLLGIDTMADPASFDARAVAIARLRQLAEGVHRTVLWVDACYAGAGRDGRELLAGRRFAVPAYATAEEEGWIEWHAAQPSELSGPLAVARHGAFTWASVGALRGWADGQLDGVVDGVITFDEASLYTLEVLRALDVRDQRPALLAGDRGAVAVTFPNGAGEARPDPAALREAARAPVPAQPTPDAAPAEPDPVAPAPPPPPPPGSAAPTDWHGTCRPVREAPEAGSGRDWAREPGTSPRATWTCAGRPFVTYVNRFPPIPGATAERLMVDNLTVPDTRVPGPVPKLEMKLPRSVGDPDAVRLGDPTTWPTVALETPRGQRLARVLPVNRTRKMLDAYGPYVVIEDDREPGALWSCRALWTGAPIQWTKAVASCVETLEGALADEAPPVGLVR